MLLVEVGKLGAINSSEKIVSNLLVPTGEW